MPVADITEARDIVFGILLTAWNAQGGTVPPLFYQDQDENAPYDIYAVAVVRHKTASQSSLTGQAGTRYASEADLLVDIYTPFGTGAKSADPYIKIVQGLFRGRKEVPDKIWFRAVIPAEQPRFGRHSKTRVVVNFVYDEVLSRS